MTEPNYSYSFGIEDVAPNPVKRKKGRKKTKRKTTRKTSRRKNVKRKPTKRKNPTRKRKTSKRRTTRKKNPTRRRKTVRRKNPMGKLNLAGLFKGDIKLETGLFAIAAGLGLKALTAKYVKPASFGKPIASVYNVGAGLGLAILFQYFGWKKTAKAFALAAGATAVVDAANYVATKGPLGKAVAMLPGKAFLGEGQYIPKDALMVAGVGETQYMALNGTYGSDVPSQLGETQYMALNGAFSGDLPTQLGNSQYMDYNGRQYAVQSNYGPDVPNQLQGSIF